MIYELTTGSYELKKASQAYVTEDCFCLEKVLYTKKVFIPEYQYMNIWIPAEYINEEGGIDSEAVKNGYTAKTAPIIFRNNCTGWLSSSPENAIENQIGINDYMRLGYIFVACGARSRNAVKNGINYGKSPMQLVDLKSGLRFLRANKDRLPGDTERIISIGGSGAGQMSLALSTTGDMPDYYPYLYAYGAAGVEKAEDGKYVSAISDAVFACQAYYPITDIANADLAYAWMRVNTPEPGVSMRFPVVADITFTPFQLELQRDEAAAFVEYINSLGLEDKEGNLLRLESLRSGSYYAKVLENLSAALNAYIAQEEDKEGFKASLLETNANGRSWVSALDDGSLKITDLDGFIANTGKDGGIFGRNKDIPGFDTLNMVSENDAFGHCDESVTHFSASLCKVLKDNYEKYLTLMNEEEKKEVDLWIEQVDGNRFLEYQAYLMNPLAILYAHKEGRQAINPPKHWRIRYGSADEHTSFTIGYNVALALWANGLDVDYSMVWNMRHGDEEEGTSTGTFTSWVESLLKEA